MKLTDRGIKWGESVPEHGCPCCDQELDSVTVEIGGCKQTDRRDPVPLTGGWAWVVRIVVIIGADYSGSSC